MCSTKFHGDEILKAKDLYKNSLRELKAVYDSMQKVLALNEEDVKSKRADILALNKDYKEYQKFLENKDAKVE